MDAVIFIVIALVLYLFGDKLVPDTSDNGLNDVIAEDTERKTSLNGSFYRDDEAFTIISDNLKEALKK